MQEMKPRKAEDLLPAVRALTARLLIEEHRFRQKEVAELMNLTPAAVTLYVKGIRAEKMVAQIKYSKQVLTIISELARRLAEGRVPRGTVSMELLDASYQVLSALRSPATPEAEVGPAPEVAEDLAIFSKLLRKRIESEQKAAELNMNLANSVRGEFTRLLFRQIAADSLRHADIAHTLLSSLQSGTIPGEELPDERAMQSVLELEGQASEEPLDDLKRLKNALVDLLVQSIEADEEKHSQLLKAVLTIKAGRVPRKAR